MFNLYFWKAATERAVKTLAQVLLALVGNDTFNVLEVDFGQSLSVALTAVVISFLTSIVSAPVSPSGSPSLIAVPPVASDETEGNH